MDAHVEELKEESADVTEQSIFGTVIDEVQEKVQDTKTAAWSEGERNTFKDPMKAGTYYEFRSRQLIWTNR